MKRLMNRVGTRIALATLVLVLIGFASMIVLTRGRVSSMARNNATESLPLMLYGGVAKVNSELGSIERIVNNISDVIEKTADMERLKTDATYFYDYETRMNEIMMANVDGSEGIIAAYIRYMPDIRGGTSGLFYTKTENGSFEAVTPTDIGQYDKSDKEHVGWFYEPLERGEAFWVDAYYNANLNDYIVSFERPCYAKDGSEIGLVGIDVSVDYLVNYMKEVAIYTTGYQAMICGPDTFITDQEVTDELKTLFTQIREKAATTANGTFESELAGEALMCSYAVLDNDWVATIMPTMGELYNEANFMVLALISIAVLTTLLIMAAIIVLTLFILKPVSRMNIHLQTLSNNDISVDISESGKDDISAMCNSIGIFVRNLRYKIAVMRQSAADLSAQAEGMDVQSDSISVIAENQNRAMGQLQYNIEDLSGSTEEIAKNTTSLAASISKLNDDSKNAIERMESVVSEAGSGKSRLDELHHNIDKINQEILSLKETVSKVGKSTEEITSITTIIDGIASKTNLLSLNASIEAARAGEAGKGFAVVAGEIGQLATQSANAVRGISDLIVEVRDVVNDTIEQTDRTVEYISSSMEASEVATKSFEVIYDMVMQASALIDHLCKEISGVNDVTISIAAITEEQTASAQEILNTVTGVYEESNTMADNSIRLKKVVEQLNTISERISEEIDIFKTEGKAD